MGCLLCTCRYVLMSILPLFRDRSKPEVSNNLDTACHVTEMIMLEFHGLPLLIMCPTTNMLTLASSVRPNSWRPLLRMYQPSCCKLHIQPRLMTCPATKILTLVLWSPFRLISEYTTNLSAVATTPTKNQRVVAQRRALKRPGVSIVR